MPETDHERACVVVLGDIGRSPRMQYHAISFTRYNFAVDIVGYGGSKVHNDVTDNYLITCHHMRNVPAFAKLEQAKEGVSDWPRLIVYVLKTLWQSMFLLLTLFSVEKPDIMIVQNPPSIPTLPICWFVARIRGSKLIIDFHNYGFTLLGLSVGKSNLLVKICAWCEKIFGRKSDVNLCVSEAMKEDLATNWNVRASVFYDCPSKIFHPVDISEKHSLFMKVSESYEEFKGRSEAIGCTRFSREVEGEISMLDNRPALIVSSTSWTEDEDFSILLDALVEYDMAAKQNKLPNVLVAITGKGPQKEMYELLIQEKQLEHVQIVTMWLAAEDYPTFLASADLGVCLHKSSSGLDLPMKVVDMFGSGIPVCAFSYPCIQELVKNEENGVLFSTSSELFRHLQNLLTGFPAGAVTLEKYRSNLSKSMLPKWNDSWHKQILPLTSDLMKAN